MKKIIISLMICSFFCLLSACHKKSDKEETAPNAVLKSGLDLSNLDTTASPNDDFYRFAYFQYKYFPAFPNGAGFDHQLAGFRDGHKVPGDVRMGYGNGAAGLDLFFEQGHHAAPAA